MMFWRLYLQFHQCAAGRWTGSIRVAGLTKAPMGAEKLAVKQGMMRAQEKLAATREYSNWQQNGFKKEIPR